MASLVGMSEEVKGQVFELEGQETRIGRSQECEIPLNSSSVSGEHCTIYRNGETYVLRDHGSTNGTRVNAKPIEEVQLSPKNIIQAGSVEFLFDMKGEKAASRVSEGAQISVDTSDAEKPESFANISPFGARSIESKKMWPVVIGLVIIVALGAVGFFLYSLLG